MNLRRPLAKRARRPWLDRLPLRLEALEGRELPAVSPISLADSTQWGVAGLKDSTGPSISGDGQLVAFTSNADDLVANDNNGVADVFVYNRSTNSVTLVTTGITGAAGGGSGGVISPDGRYVVFASNSQQILPDFANDNQSQLFLRDLQTGTTTLLSGAAGGAGGNRGGLGPIFSADSHFVVFVSSSNNLTPGYTFTGVRDNLFRRDLTAGTTQLVSVSLDGKSGGDGNTLNMSNHPEVAVSANGRFIAFASSSANLVANDGNGLEDIFFRDMVAGTTQLVSTTPTGLTTANGHSNLFPGQAISADGRYVVFQSAATNLVSGPFGNSNRAYLRDTLTATTIAVSRDTLGTVRQGDGSVISSDGRYVAFVSTEKLIPADLNGMNDVYIFDTAASQLSLASVSMNSASGGNASSGDNSNITARGGLVFSADSKLLAFTSDAIDLTPGVTTGGQDNLYQRNIAAKTTTLVTSNLAGTDGGTGGSAFIPALSANGSIVALQSNAPNLVAGDTNRVADVFVRDIAAATTALASARTSLLPAAFTTNGSGTLGSVSADGRYVVFTSNVFFGNSFSDLAPSVSFTSGGGQSHIFVRDRQTGSIEVVDVNPAGTAVGANSPIISADGRYVAFYSTQTSLVSGITYTPGAGNVFIRDLQTDTTRIVSVDAAGTHDAPVTGPLPLEIAMSDDGRYVAYVNTHTAPLPGVSNPSGKRQVFLRDLQSNKVWHVSHNVANDGAVNGNSLNISASSDGRYVLFGSDDAKLAKNDANAAFDVFRWDRTTDTVDLVSVNSGANGTANGASSGTFDRPVMSPDGRFVAFSSAATDLVGGDTNGRTDIFRRDMQSGQTVMASMNAAGTGGANNNSTNPSINADGSRVAFSSVATNLTGDKLNTTNNVYVRLLGGTQSTQLVSINVANAGGGNNSSISPFISPDGRYVAFLSHASDLVPNYVDGNGTGFLHEDLFLRDLTLGVTRAVNLNISGTASADAGENGNPANRVFFTSDSATLVFDGSATNLIAHDQNAGNDAFVTKTAGFSSIAGQVFGDVDMNGAKNGGETGIQFWTVYIDGNANAAFDFGEQYALTDASGKYLLPNLTPGSYSVRIVPQTGYLLTSLPTSHAVNIAADGTASTGKDFGEARPLPDLAVSSVASVQPTGSPGQKITVNWHVANSGQAVAAGSWRDAIYLSSTPTLTASSILLTTVENNGGLAAGGFYDGSVSVAVPPVAAGSYYLIVRADFRNQVFEGELGANKINNTATSAGTVAISVPSFSVGSPANGTFTGAGDGRYFKITANAGQTLRIILNSSASTGTTELYIRRGDFPSPGNFDFASLVPGQPDQFITVPTSAAGIYYVFVRATGGAAATDDFSVNASLPAFEVTSLSQTTGGNTGKVSVAVHGAQFSTSSWVELLRAPEGQVLGQTLAAESVVYKDSTTLYATFDLTQAHFALPYVLRVVDGSRAPGDQVTIAPIPFTVVAGQSTAVQIDLIVPDFVRFGRPSYMLVTYTNTSTNDAIAPLLTITADKAALSLPEQKSPPSNTIQFLAINASGPAGVLPPGYKGTMRVNLSSTTPLAPDDIHFQAGIANDTATMDWASIKDSLRPDHITPEAWNAVFANLTASVGTTVGAYHKALADNATYLSQFGEFTVDVQRLYRFELNKANDVFTSQSLARVSDVSFPAPGMPLTFIRQFQQSLAGRYTVGPFGRGWTHNWQYSLATNSDGNIEIMENGIHRFFAKLANGTFVGVAGDDAVLTRVDGGYYVREASGTLVAFNSNGTLNFVQDSNGNRITAGYSSGRLTSLTHSDGDAIVIHYNAQGLIDQVTDPGNRTVTYTYDGAGEHLTGYTDKYGSHSYSYLVGQSNPALNHALTQIAYSDNTHIFFTYDTRGRLIDYRRDNNQEAVAYTYGPTAGYSVTTLSGGQTTYQIDDAGQVVQVIDPLGRIINHAYDDARNLIRTTAGLGTNYSYTYDDQGNQTSMTDPLGNQVTFTYDDAHHLIGYEDARGNATAYRIDGKGNMLSVTYADGSAQNYGYDAVGNLDSSVNARGQALQYTYFANGLLKQKTYADSTTVKYEYDAHGNLTKVTDRAGAETTLLYDSADNLTRINYPGGRFLQYQYNIVGQRTQSIDQTGFTVNYAYDALGRLLKLRDTANVLLVQYSYDANGRLAAKEMGNGTYTTYEYDAAGQLLHLVNRAPRPAPEQDGPVNSRFDYTYDAIGLVSSAESYDGVWNYSYDAAGQLTHAVFTSNNAGVIPDQDLQYSYDAAGNRTQSIINGVTTAYVANNVNKYTQVGNTAYTYDLDANLSTATTGGVTTNYSFDQDNQLTSISNPSDAFGYQYDALGNRVAATHNGQTTQFQFDPIGLWNVSATFDGGGGLLAHYVSALGLVGQVASGGAQSYYDFDQSGNTAGVSGVTGAYESTFAFLPFGQLAASSGAATPFTFGGQYGVQSDGSGLVNMRARNYDPTIGQFVSNDPLGLVGSGANLRVYALNSPTNFVDPSGLKPGWFDSVTPITCNDFKAGEKDKLPTSKIGDPIILNNPDDKGRDLPTTIDSKDGNKYYFKDGAGRYWSYTIGDPGNASAPPPDSAAGGSGAGGCPDCGCTYPPCPPPPTSDGGSKKTTSGKGFDPNDMIGPRGYGDAHFIAPDETLPYTIEFENDPIKATLPVQDITVTQQLDADLDWDTFELGEIRFGSTSVAVPEGLRSFTTGVSATNIDGTPLRVEINVSLDPDTGIVTWTFHSVDPATGITPESAIAGFLPVDDETGKGQGSVTYTIRAKLGTPSLTPIDAKARIVFDTNDPLDTPTRTNIIDAGSPIGRVNDLPEFSTGLNFTVSWAGQDNPNEAGVASFDVYASDDGGSWTLWQSATPSMSALFAGQEYHTYRFYALARDGVGNVEPNVPGAEATITATDGQFSRGDAYGADSGKTLIVQASAGVLANDTKKPGRTYVAQLVTWPAHGTLTLNPSGGFTYAPNGTFTGLDSFTYRTRDNTGHLGNLASVTLATQLVGFRVESQSVTESSGTGSIWVDLRNAATQTITVDYTVTARSATPGTDFTLANGTVTFTPGQRIKAIPFVINNDALDEFDETFSIKLSNPSNAVLGKSTSTLITIVDDDSPPIVGFTKSSMTSSEGVTSPAIEVRFSAASGKPVTVRYTLTGGSAKNETDFTLSGDSLTFGPGETLKLIPLAIINDGLHEADETVMLALSAATNAKLGRAGHKLTIDDDDPPPLVNFATTSSNVGEGDAFANLTVSLTAPSALPVTVKVLVTGGTATRDNDFRVLTWYLLTFAPGETTKTVKLAIVDDAMHEGNETTLISLLSPVGATLGPAGSHTVTIFDND